jgi:hypothetical protein
VTQDNAGKLEPLPVDIRYDYAGRCWWCGLPADSREHRYKKSDVVREFGKGPWQGNESLLRITAGSNRHQRIQGPNADGLKFGTSLCQACNNRRSQPFDRAYDTFASYVSQNEAKILRLGFISLRRVFGRAWRADRDNVVRFYVKHIGCRFAEDGVQVPQSFIEYLDGSTRRPRGLSLTLQIRTDILAMEHHMQEVHNVPGGSLWMGDSQATYSKSSRQVTDVWSHIGVGALRASYHVNAHKNSYRSNLNARYVPIRGAYNQPPDEVAKACTWCSGV